MGRRISLGEALKSLLFQNLSFDTQKSHGKKNERRKASAPTCEINFARKGKFLFNLSFLCQELEVESLSKEERNCLGGKIKVGEENCRTSFERFQCGTLVFLRGIFHNLPVRRKAFNVEQERERLVRCVESISLAFPAVSFSVKENDVDLVFLPSCESTEERMAQIYDEGILRVFVQPFCLEKEGIAVKARLSPLEYGFNSKEIQFICTLPATLFL